ncbi:hypothetical protein BU17DRAFT_71662 [Hysterangium stoloniferum]|nr:hypothetical protein BU17DRAFT_71662 [Hysterangium stoloniferum]
MDIETIALKVAGDAVPVPGLKKPLVEVHVDLNERESRYLDEEGNGIKGIPPHELMIIIYLETRVVVEMPHNFHSGEVEPRTIFLFEPTSPRHTSGPSGGPVLDVHLRASFDAEPSWINDPVWPDTVFERDSINVLNEVDTLFSAT